MYYRHANTTIMLMKSKLIGDAGFIMSGGPELAGSYAASLTNQLNFIHLFCG